MSADEETVNRRETAFRLFATEFEDSDISYTESDEERAPNYVITPTGARVNRLFVVGVLTEVQQVSDDVLRARVVDPTGAFVVYAGQYQPDEQAFLERTEPPAFVAVAGKARTFQPEDSDVVYTSIRPESINEVDAETRDRWTVRTAERTLDRIGAMAAALESNGGEGLQERLADQGVPEGLAAGIPLAIEHYGTSGQYLDALRETALDALRVVADEREEVADRSVAPDASGEADLSALANIELSTPEPDEPAARPDAATADSRAGTATGSEPAGTPDSEPSGGGTESADEAESVADTGGQTDTTVEESTATAEDTTSSEETTAPAGEAATADGVTRESSADAESETADTGGETGTDAESETADTGGDELGDFDPEEFDLDEETREEVQSEYGTEFQSGTEVDEPGEAGIDTPEPEEPAVESDTATETGGSEPTTETSASEPETETADPEEATGSEPTTEGGESESPDESEAVDLEDAVMDAMTELDDGDGADREQVIAAVVEQGADPGAVEDAVQDALMDGRCYEPDDETLKPI